MTMNRQSNLYTVIYSVVLVVIVGVVLSIVYQALRPQQEENIANDTKRQILAAALIVPSENRSVAELYSTHITDSYIVNTEGERVDANIDPFSVNVSLEVKKPAAERILPVFVCDTKSGVKYMDTWPSAAGCRGCGSAPGAERRQSLYPEYSPEGADGGSAE